MTYEPETSDVLDGVAEIAAFMRIDRRRCQWHIDQGRLPIYRLGRRIFARRSTLTRWMAEQEQRHE